MPDKLTDNLANNSPILANELSDGEIKKALECCKYSIYEKRCVDCLLIDEKRCIELVTKSALDLINRQDQENESLKAEIQELKIEINMFRGYDEEIKAEAYKEFATKTTDKVERVKQKYERLCKEQGEKMEEHMHIHFNGIIKIVKDLLNELVGDGDGES